jgi:hypothetical protein
MLRSAIHSRQDTQPQNLGRPSGLGAEAKGKISILPLNVNFNMINYKLSDLNRASFVVVELGDDKLARWVVERIFH